MSACRPLIICEENILKHILSAFITKEIKEIHIFEYFIAQFRCFFGVVWHGDFVFLKKFSFRNINITRRSLVLFGS